MTYRLLIVTFYCDLPNLKICLFLLNQFWKSDRSITIVYNLKLNKHYREVEEDKVLNFIKNCAEEILIDWDYEIKLGVDSPNLVGWSEQQLDKVIFSANHKTEYTIVFDCKDFVYDFFKFEDFFYENKIKIIEIADECKAFVEYSRPFFPIDINDIHPHPLSPWIWKNSEVKDLTTCSSKNFGKLEECSNYTTVCYMDWFYYKKYILKQNINEKFYFTKDREFPTFQHHRLRDIHKIKETSEILSNIGVPINYVTEWKNSVLKFAIIP